MVANLFKGLKVEIHEKKEKRVVRFVFWLLIVFGSVVHDRFAGPNVRRPKQRFRHEYLFSKNTTITLFVPPSGERVRNLITSPSTMHLNCLTETPFISEPQISVPKNNIFFPTNSTEREKNRHEHYGSI